MNLPAIMVHFQAKRKLKSYWDFSRYNFEKLIRTHLQTPRQSRNFLRITDSRNLNNVVWKMNSQTLKV